MPEPLNRRGYLMAQRRAQVPSTFPIDDREDGFDFSIDHLLPSRRRRRRRSSSTSTSQESLLFSPKPEKTGRPKSKYAKTTDSLDRRSSSPRQQLPPRLSQSGNTQEVDHEMKKDMARRLEQERAEAAVGFLVPTTKGKKIQSTVASGTVGSSDNETSSDPEKKRKQSQKIVISPAPRAPIAYMSTFQPSGTTQTKGKRIKLYAHKSTSNSVPRASTSKGPVAIKEPTSTKVSQHQTAAASQGSGHIDEQRPHLPAVQSGQALTKSDRSAPIKAGRKQIASRAAKKSVLSQRREDISPPKKRLESPEVSSGEEMVYVPGFHLVEPDWSDDDDDEDGEIYRHSDGRLRTTAAQSSRSRRRHTSSPSASISPQKKRSMKTSDEVIRAALRPANQPPPKLQVSPGELKKLGLEGVAELEKGKVDRSFDKNAPGYSEHGRYSRYINRTDWSGPRRVKAPYAEHMMRADFYYPEEVPKIKQPTPPPPPTPRPPPPALPQRQQQQQMRAPTASRRHQQQQQRRRDRSIASSPPRHRHHQQQQQRGASVAYQRPREQFQIRDDEAVVADKEAPPQATPGPQNPTPRGRPGWISGEWMDLARKMADEDPLAKFLKKKD